MKQKHTEFLNQIEQYVAQYPEIGAYVSDSVANGLTTALSSVRDRASDMEVALAVSIAQRYKNRDALILSKLNKWKNASSINWNSTIKMIEEKEACK